MKVKISRRISVLLLALLILIGTIPHAFAEDAEESAVPADAAKPKTAFERISIKSVEDLLELAELCRLDTWSVGKLVILEADLSLEDAAFLPIPSFGGVFDGNGHTISGLQIDQSIIPAGLFGELQESGVVRDLNVSGTVAPSGDARFVGGVAGENHGTIRDCTFTGCIVGSDSVGGIAGANAVTGKIAGCEASGSVIGTDRTGGIVGCNLGMIGNSVNKACVNTVGADPAVDLEDINFDFLTDVSKLSSLDTSAAAMDTGGIAGYSSGILERCTNRASVGYPHIGYNVGGIAGRSCGSIQNCENAADVFGRKDVGGIAGQMEPYIAQDLSESALAKLERQLDELDALVDQAMGHADGAADSVSRRLNAIAESMDAAGAAVQEIRTSSTIDGSVIGSGAADRDGSITGAPPQLELGENGLDLTEGSLSGSGQTSGNGRVDAQTQIDVRTNLNGLSSALYGMAGQMSLLSGEIGGASDVLYADVQQIRGKINEITDTAFAMLLGDGEAEVIVDTSQVDIDLVTLGKVSECVNRSFVNGDINTGGIAGAMAMEAELDPEDDVTIRVDGSEQRKYEVKAIVQKCENAGSVVAKRSYAGGIAGKMDLGLIAQCESYGTVSSQSGSYVGGIAGIGGSTIRHCFAKCSLSGKQYVGGIVGSGVEQDRKGESSTVAGCYAMVTVTDCQQYAGAISGYPAGAFLENYFVSEELSGINRMSYAGNAEPVSYGELIRMLEPKEEASDASAALELPDEFHEFTLKFVADGKLIHSERFDYGASFGAEAFPDVPAKEGYYGYWDRTDLNDLRFDTTVSAVYEPYITALRSVDARKDGKSIFYVEGLFGEDDSLTAEAMIPAPDGLDLPDGVWDALRKSFTRARLNTGVVEQWQLRIPADGLSTHTIRYLPPDGKADRLSLYLLQEGKWTRLETEKVGSFVTFPVEGQLVTIAAVSGMQVWWVWLIVAALALMLGVGMLLLIRRLRSKKQKAAPASEPKGPHEGDSAKETSAPAPSPAERRRQKRWLTPLLVILALLLGIAGTAAFFLLPDLLSGAAAYDLLQAYASKEAVSMRLQAEAVVGEQSVPVDALLDRVTLDGQRVTVVTEGGRSLYYADGAVMLENGSAYRISDACPDYSALLEQTMALYQHADIEAANNAYSITAEKENAAALLKLLLPSAAPFLSETDALNVDLIVREGELKQIQFTGSGRLNDGKETAFSVSAVLQCEDSPRDIRLPQAVAESIQSGAYEPNAVLTDDLLRLLNGWQALQSASPLYARLTLSADCGPLQINDRLDFYRWDAEPEPIYSLEQNGYALYFTENALCDARGNAVPAVSTANVDAARLLDAAYSFCLNAAADCQTKGAQSVYTVSLDEAGMEQVARVIAPDAEKLGVACTSGSLRIVVSDERIESVELTVSRSLPVALTSADVAMRAKWEFSGQTPEAAVPEAVMQALQEQAVRDMGSTAAE